MATEGEYEKVGVDLQLQGSNEVEVRITTTQKFVGLPESGLLRLNHEAIRELGCRIVAQALDDGSTVGFA
jgi:hypothetical protein